MLLCFMKGTVPFKGFGNPNRSKPDIAIKQKQLIFIK